VTKQNLSVILLPVELFARLAFRYTLQPDESCYEVCLQSKRRIHLSFCYDKFVNAGGGTIDGTVTWLGESTAGGSRYEGQVEGTFLSLLQSATKAAAETEAQLVMPLLQFRNYGRQLPHYWSTISNGAAFGTDYFTRTAVARSNILVNSPNETKYYYQDLDDSGGRLNGANRYVVTFPKDQTPPINGFWSLTLYNEHHFFAPNQINRYSVGTKNKDLKYSSDGSLIIYVQSDPPADTQRTNWLPAPKDADLSLFMRAYWTEGYRFGRLLDPTRRAKGELNRSPKQSFYNRVHSMDHTDYAIGRTQAEYQRLIEQADILDAEALKFADERRAAQGIAKVEFRQSDARSANSGRLFDAAVGGLVLLYMNDPRRHCVKSPSEFVSAASWRFRRRSREMGSEQ
jgi:hypothetical protein